MSGKITSAANSFALGIIIYAGPDSPLAKVLKTLSQTPRWRYPIPFDHSSCFCLLFHIAGFRLARSLKFLHEAGKAAATLFLLEHFQRHPPLHRLLARCNNVLLSDVTTFIPIFVEFFVIISPNRPDALAEPLVPLTILLDPLLNLPLVRARDGTARF